MVLNFYLKSNFLVEARKLINNTPFINILKEKYSEDDELQFCASWTLNNLTQKPKEKVGCLVTDLTISRFLKFD